ncbi:sensor histidine kinase [Rhizobium sp. SSA_523]|uniref:sensor histidine kinase n=1 Tax=Rhizobium sp. SSA_523 TaxID=2952477 RepID=UPI002091A6C0|nr:sensor histidine kinase [Rhizobium sp. SSA_523]MCO5731720.1 sensor histidine kinase [Rhizobium sp. SSA_523]WKC25729.1 sensor histidine kinase [Rhizobium sp. SSA_523]
MKLSRLLPTAPLGVYLMALAAVTALPFILFSVFLMLRLEAQQRETLNSATEENARLIARTIDRELRDSATTLRLISTSPELRSGELAAFHQRTQDSLHGSARYILLTDRDGTQKLNTRMPYGEPLNQMSNMEGLRSVLKSGSIEVSDVFFGATSRRWVFNLLMPLPSELAATGAALVLTQNAEDLQKVISTEALPKGWATAVLDSKGNVVSSTTAWPGEASPIAQNTLSLMSGLSGSIEDVGGNPRLLYGYAQLPDWRWKVVVWGPIAAAQTTIITTWRYLVIGSLVILAGSMALSYLLARQLRSPIRQIAHMADRIGRGEIVSPVTTRIQEANQIAVALSNASFDRSEAEDRIHLIMHELVHRTKNIMTLIQAMMRQLARRETSMPEFQRAIGERLQGLGKSIEMLAQEQWAGVPIARVVALHMETFAETRNRVAIDGPDFTLRAEAVQNLGLVLHELATNSIKYGALSVPAGHVHFQWTEETGERGEPVIRLRWQEFDGPEVAPPSSTGFGTTIIQRHAAAAFNGHVTLDYLPDGFVWTLVGPRDQFERNTTADAKDEN